MAAAQGHAAEDRKAPRLLPTVVAALVRQQTPAARGVEGTSLAVIAAFQMPTVQKQMAASRPLCEDGTAALLLLVMEPLEIVWVPLPKV